MSASPVLARSRLLASGPEPDSVDAVLVFRVTRPGSVDPLPLSPVITVLPPPCRLPRRAVGAAGFTKHKTPDVTLRRAIGAMSTAADGCAHPTLTKDDHAHENQQRLAPLNGGQRSGDERRPVVLISWQRRPFNFLSSCLDASEHQPQKRSGQHHGQTMGGIVEHTEGLAGGGPLDDACHVSCIIPQETLGERCDRGGHRGYPEQTEHKEIR